MARGLSFAVVLPALNLVGKKGHLRQASALTEAVARDLQRTHARASFFAGDNQPPIIHAFAHAMNNALGNVGKTVFYTDPLEELIR